jgi:hypothetical protein
MGTALRSKPSAPLPYSNGARNSVVGVLFESSPRPIGGAQVSGTVAIVGNGPSGFLHIRLTLRCRLLARTGQAMSELSPLLVPNRTPAMHHGQPERLESKRYPQQARASEELADCRGRLFERRKIRKVIAAQGPLKRSPFSREGSPTPAWPVSN